jgi:hypothetical protein
MLIGTYANRDVTPISAQLRNYTETDEARRHGQQITERDRNSYTRHFLPSLQKGKKPIQADRSPTTMACPLRQLVLSHLILAERQREDLRKMAPIRRVIQTPPYLHTSEDEYRHLHNCTYETKYSYIDSFIYQICRRLHNCLSDLKYMDASITACTERGT